MKNGRAILNRDFEQVSFPSLSLVFPPLFQTLYERGLFTFNSRKIEREREREREREKKEKHLQAQKFTRKLVSRPIGVCTRRKSLTLWVYPVRLYDLTSTFVPRQGLWKIKAYFWHKRAEKEFVVKERTLVKLEYYNSKKKKKKEKERGGREDRICDVNFFRILGTSS